jgi:hypothetical protein
MRNNARLAAVAAGAVLLSIAACGGGSGPSAPTAPPAPTVPVSSACGALGQTVAASSPTAIVNGTDCTGAAAAVVLLNLRDPGGQPSGACTGTVIAARAILTAAHCLPSTAASINVFLGTGPQQPALSFTPHPAWRESNATAFDVGVILMPADIGRAPAPLLLSRDARVGETAILAGWGRDGSGVGATLRAGSATITGVTALTLQTTFTTTASSVCQGDSGGPILINEGGAWAIGGVISANSTIACSFGDNFYANLRHPDISAFILAQVPDAARK